MTVVKPDGCPHCGGKTLLGVTEHRRDCRCYQSRPLGTAKGTEYCRLTFSTLRGANLARIPTFRNKHGDLAHSESDGSDWSPAEWLQAMVGELGEYANKRKKFERGDLTEEEFSIEAAKELADVMIYLDILAYQVGVDLGQAVIDKFNEVSDRVNSPVKIDPWGHGFKTI